MLIFELILTILLQFSIKKTTPKNSRNQQLYVTRSEDFHIFPIFNFLKWAIRTL